MKAIERDRCKNRHPLCKAALRLVCMVWHVDLLVGHSVACLQFFYHGRIIADAAPVIVFANPKVKRYVVGGELHRMDEQREGMSVIRCVGIA